MSEDKSNEMNKMIKMVSKVKCVKETSRALKLADSQISKIVQCLFEPVDLVSSILENTANDIKFNDQNNAISG